MCEFMLTVIGKNFNRRKPSMDHWKNFSVGSSACHLAVSQIQKRNELDVELTFDWRELPERKASRIVLEKSVSLNDKNQWNA